MFLVFIIFTSITSAITTPCPDCDTYCSCVMSKGKPAEVPLAKMQDAYVYCNQKYPQKPKGKKIEVNLRSYYKCKMPGCKCVKDMYKRLNYEMSDKAMDYFGYHNLLASAAREKVADCVAKKLGLAQPAFDGLRKQYQNIQDSFAFCYTQECGASFALMRAMTEKCAVKHGVLPENDVSNDVNVLIPFMAADQKTVAGSFNSVHGSSISFDQKTVTDSFNTVSDSTIDFDQKHVSNSLSGVAGNAIAFDHRYVLRRFRGGNRSNSDSDSNSDESSDSDDSDSAKSASSDSDSGDSDSEKSDSDGSGSDSDEDFKYYYRYSAQKHQAPAYSTERKHSKVRHTPGTPRKQRAQKTVTNSLNKVKNSQISFDQ